MVMIFTLKKTYAKWQAAPPSMTRTAEAGSRALSELLNDHDQSIIIACSALKQSYRDILTSGNIKPRFVYLQGSRELLEERAHARSGQEDHFMPATLLDSQLDTLEQPSSEALTISIELAPEQITETILAS